MNKPEQITKPIAESCLRNQTPIAHALLPLLQDRQRLLEIASGTGQHAVYLANRLPHLIWQCSDLPECLPGIRLWAEEAVHRNIPEPIVLDVRQTDWPASGHYDAVFTANSIHFIGLDKVVALLSGVGNLLTKGALFCVYGPFNQHSRFTSEGNQQLDAWLKSRDAESGIKDIETVLNLCAEQSLIHQNTLSMPANNLMLVFEKND